MPHKKDNFKKKFGLNPDSIHVPRDPDSDCIELDPEPTRNGTLISKSSLKKKKKRSIFGFTDAFFYGNYKFEKLLGLQLSRIRI